MVKEVQEGKLDHVRNNLAGAKGDEVSQEVCDCAEAVVAAHISGTQGVFVMLRLSGTLHFEDAMLMLSIPSLEDEGGLGSSGRPLGGKVVSNSILKVLRDEQDSVDSLKRCCS